MKDLAFIEKFQKERMFSVPPEVFPPLNDPEVVAADRADHMRDSDLVLGVTLAGKSRAYPGWILDNSHVANDTLAGAPIVVVA